MNVLRKFHAIGKVIEDTTSKYARSILFLINSNRMDLV